MKLPNDVSRCPGRVDGGIRKRLDDECSGCVRRLAWLDATEDEAARVAWMGPPAERPCPMRIAAQEVGV